MLGKILNQSMLPTEFGMSKFEYGFVRAISEIIAELIMSVLLSFFVNAG